MNKCEIYNTDCIEFMKKMSKGSVNCVLTDIPYGEVSRANNGLSQMKNSDKGAADATTFNLNEFLPLVDKVASDNIIIFCGKGQFSTIYNYFAAKSAGTVRQLIWKLTQFLQMEDMYILVVLKMLFGFVNPKAHIMAIVKILFLSILYKISKYILQKKIINFLKN